MTGWEALCAVIVALWCIARLAIEPSTRALWLKLLVVAVAAWVAEDTSIRWYSFYFYSRAHWSLFVDQVPLMILCIWPVVIVSAYDLSVALWPSVTSWRRGGIVMGLVWCDASLIEPIATHTGLWTWTEGGLWRVPIIGILGWGFFSFGVGAVLATRPLLALLVGPVVCHALLVGTWWAGFRFITVEILPWPVVIVVAIVAVVVARQAARLDPARHASVWRHVVTRTPAALFFFGLLAVFCRDVPSLCLYAVCFAPPWLALALRRPASLPLPQTPPIS